MFISFFYMGLVKTNRKHEDLMKALNTLCLLYTSDAADDYLEV